MYMFYAQSMSNFQAVLRTPLHVTCPCNEGCTVTTGAYLYASNSGWTYNMPLSFCQVGIHLLVKIIERATTRMIFAYSGRSFES
jgi:hypothetical protein